MRIEMKMSRICLSGRGRDHYTLGDKLTLGGGCWSEFLKGTLLATLGYVALEMGITTSLVVTVGYSGAFQAWATHPSNYALWLGSIIGCAILCLVLEFIILIYFKKTDLQNSRYKFIIVHVLALFFTVGLSFFAMLLATVYSMHIMTMLFGGIFGYVLLLLAFSPCLNLGKVLSGQILFATFTYLFLFTIGSGVAANLTGYTFVWLAPFGVMIYSFMLLHTIQQLEIRAEWWHAVQHSLALHAAPVLVCFAFCGRCSVRHEKEPILGDDAENRKSAFIN